MEKEPLTIESLKKALVELSKQHGSLSIAIAPEGVFVKFLDEKKALEVAREMFPNG